MIRITIFIFTSLWGAHCAGCMFPEGGSEYDSKLIIDKLIEENRYRLTVPKKLKSSGSVKIYLGYAKESENQFRYLEYGQRIKYWFQGKIVEVEFTAPPKEGYKPYVHVLWPGEVCDTVANSKNLDELE